MTADSILPPNRAPDEPPVTGHPARAVTLTVPDGVPVAEAARRYAEAGFRVFPLHTPDPSGACSCRKPGCDTVGKHPRTFNGVTGATADPAQVADWWGKWPTANIGIATGRPSGIVVPDVDPAHDGLASLDALEARHRPLPPTWVVETGGGGFHYWFRLPPGIDVRNSAGVLGPGLDVRGTGGYVVAPPSRHASGNAYRWDSLWNPATLDLADPPPWLVRLLVDPRTGGAGAARSVTPGALIPQGTRRHELLRIGGAMRRVGCTEAEIRGALDIANRDRCRPPLDDGEVAKLAADVAARYPPASVGSAGTEGLPVGVVIVRNGREEVVS